MGSGQVEKRSLLLVVAKVSQPVEVIVMWVEGRFGVHPVASSVRLNCSMRPAIDIYVFGAAYCADLFQPTRLKIPSHGKGCTLQQGRVPTVVKTSIYFYPLFTLS